MSMSPFLMFFLAFIFSVCVFAWAKGGPAERYGALFIAVSAVAVELVHWFLPRDLQGLLLLAVDGFLAASFLLLALRYASAWLGGAMLLQAIQFSLHAYYFVTGVHRGDTYAIINNLDSTGVMLCIVIGTVIAWRKRRAEK